MPSGLCSKSGARMMLRLEDPFPQEYEGSENSFPQEYEGIEDPCPQESDGPAQLSRVFILPVGLLFWVQYFSWGPAGGRRWGFAGAKAFGTADQTAVREPYDFAVSEAHVAGGAGQLDFLSFASSAFPCSRSPARPG